LASIPHGGGRRPVQAATIAVVAKVGKVSPRTISNTKALKRDAIPTVVDAVKRGEVPIAQAAAFVSKTPPLDQARIIADLGSPAAAVKAAIRAKADRATVKKPKPSPDVTAAADRAEARAKLAVVPAEPAVERAGYINCRSVLGGLHHQYVRI
jgi:hypothetical protein